MSSRSLVEEQKPFGSVVQSLARTPFSECLFGRVFFVQVTIAWSCQALTVSSNTKATEADVKRECQREKGDVDRESGTWVA